MFDTICDTVPGDGAMPPRVRRLEILRRVLDGSIYNGLPYEFHQERNSAGEYVPLKLRKPSVRYGLCRIVVEDSVALLFSNAHFPTVESADPEMCRVLADIISETRMNEVMIDAAIRGSVGSVAILIRILNGRIFLSVLDSLYLTPQWDTQAPDTLKYVKEIYQVSGEALLTQGYAGVEAGVTYWFRRDWDVASETWYIPWPVNDPLAVPKIDTVRSMGHGLGFVPIVWIRNLPGGDGIDGGLVR